MNVGDASFFKPDKGRVNRQTDGQNFLHCAYTAQVCLVLLGYFQQGTRYESGSKSSFVSNDEQLHSIKYLSI
jgi:hypothetical protein